MPICIPPQLPKTSLQRPDSVRILISMAMDMGKEVDFPPQKDTVNFYKLPQSYSFLIEKRHGGLDNYPFFRRCKYLCNLLVH